MSDAEEIQELAHLLAKHRDRVAIVANLKTPLPSIVMDQVIHCVQDESVLVTVKLAGDA